MTELAQTQAPAAPVVPPRLGEVGRIRLGHKKVSKAGKEYPARLEQFRLTSLDHTLLARASQLYAGGTAPVEWTDGNDRKGWELFTDATELAVAVLLTGDYFSQTYEEWRGGVCARRSTEPFEGGDLITRLNVLLPDIGSLGLWRMETGGWYAATELAGAAMLLEQARAAGARMVRAVLRLEPRTRKLLLDEVDPDTGKRKVETRKFVVPTLTPDLGQFVDRMIATVADQSAQQIEAPSNVRELAPPEESGPVGEFGGRRPPARTTTPTRAPGDQVAPASATTPADPDLLWLAKGSGDEETKRYFSQAASANGRRTLWRQATAEAQDRAMELLANRGTAEVTELRPGDSAQQALAEGPEGVA